MTIKEISIGRGRKYSKNYQSVDYHIGITVEGEKIADMRKEAVKALITLEKEEEIRCRDVMLLMDYNETKEFKEAVEELEIVKDKLEIKKLPKSTKKVPANGKYKIAGKPCKKCGGNITWDGWTQGSGPIHVDADGNLLGNGDCPNYDGGGS